MVARRIVVVGPPGSGKTTTAAEIGRRSGLPHIELDALYWEPGWTIAAPDMFRTRVSAAVATERWVTDGNYFTSTHDITWPLADTIVWLDLPRRTTVRRVVWRTGSRAVLRTQLWSGNRESLRMVLGRDEIVRFAWREYPKYPQRYAALMHDHEWVHLHWVRLRSPRAVRTWLRSLGA